ncbi:hypothetical protein PG997_005774 [Apiospora hydei]|uniref:MAT1-1-2 n=1 Tax=Apiospora hydei TaxID=1337664 RepID=A0ABR1WM45_9PEZI
MKSFGWKDIDSTRVDRIIRCLAEISELEDKETNIVASSLACLEKMMRSAADLYEKQFGSSPLKLTGEKNEEISIVEFAIHLATEALLFSLCEERPARAVYRLLEPFLLSRNADPLFALAFGAPRYSIYDKKVHKGPCTYWDLRQSVMQAMISAAEDPGQSDLAICEDGYVAYQGVLDHVNEGIPTNKQVAGSIRVCPGWLKLRGRNSNYRKLVEESEPSLLSSRVDDSRTYPVELLSPMGTFQGIPEVDSTDRLGISVKHVVRASNEVAGSLQILTYLSEPHNDPVNPGTISRISANWQLSICAAIFSQICEDTTVRTPQLQILADRWNKKGDLGENLQWCHVGRETRGAKCWITTTHKSEALRFFEAGNLAFRGNPVFIHPPTVPLVYCIKEVMEKSQNGWVLIA